MFVQEGNISVVFALSESKKKQDSLRIYAHQFLFYMKVSGGFKSDFKDKEIHWFLVRQMIYKWRLWALSPSLAITQWSLVMAKRFKVIHETG